MMAHVAEAGEGRGRVILRVSSFSANDVAIEAAMLVAIAFHSEVEVLCVEDSQRVDFAGFPFAREVPLRGGAPRQVSARAVRAEMRAAFADARARVDAMAAARDVPTYAHLVRDDPVQALVSACAQRGPWNMIAIAETYTSAGARALDDVFESVSDTTGVIVVGPGVRERRRRRVRTSHAPPIGPVVLVVEDAEQLESMLRAGRTIAAALEAEIMLLLVATSADDFERLDAETRLVLAEGQGVGIGRSMATYGEQAAVAQAIRVLRGRFVIAPYGGIVAPRRRSLLPLLIALNCPLLLVR